MVDQDLSYARDIARVLRACVAHRPAEAVTDLFTHHEVSVGVPAEDDPDQTREIRLVRCEETGESKDLANFFVDARTLELFEEIWSQTNTLIPPCQNADYL